MVRVAARHCRGTADHAGALPPPPEGQVSRNLSLCEVWADEIIGGIINGVPLIVVRDPQLAGLVIQRSVFGFEIADVQALLCELTLNGSPDPVIEDSHVGESG